MNDNNSLAQEMQLQIACRVCTERSKENVLSREAIKDKRNIKNTMPRQFVFECMVENESIQLHVVVEKEEQFGDMKFGQLHIGIGKFGAKDTIQIQLEKVQHQ